MSDSKMNIVKLEKKHFELGSTIYKFTSNFLNQNQGRRLPPTRQEVNLHWSWQVMNAYPNSDDPMRIFLLEQISCPLIEALWEKRADEEAFKQKRTKQRESGFHPITRNLTARENKDYPFAAIMTHALHGEVIVPEILNRPLHRIAYLDLVRKILVANPAKILDLFVLHDLWDAILSKVYDYEFDWREDKKAEGKTADIHQYLKIVEDVTQSEKRKRSEIEEVSDDSEIPLAKIKHARSLAKAGKDPEASHSSDTLRSTTTKAGVKPKAPEAAAGLGSPGVQSSITKVQIPPHTRPFNAASARPSTTDSNSAQFSRRRIQPPPPPPPPTPPPSSSLVSKRKLLSDREWRLLSHGIPPWEFDPITGERMKITTGYRKKGFFQPR